MWDVQLVGAFCFGTIIGWYVYYINRYRKGDVQFSDLVTVLGIIGGAAVLKLFGDPGADGEAAGTRLFGAYGIGLFTGFFAYLIVLAAMVAKSGNFNVDWFLDGRRKKLAKDEAIPEGYRDTVAAMGHDEERGGP